MSLDPLLAELTRHPEISGAELARSLGISRAAVWKQIDRLRALGLPIEAQAGAGYRLAHPLQLLDVTHIRRALDADTQRLLARLEIVNETASTSADLLAGVSNLRSGSCLIAEAQTAGRGQRGRRWQSPFASGFLGSVLWHFDQGLASLGGLSLAMGVAVADALADCGAKVQIKWPNDIIVDGRKLGGILVDAGGEAHGNCHVVVGLGLNGRLPEAAYAEIDQPVTDLARILERDIDRNELAARLLTRLLQGLHAFAQHGFAGIRTRYLELDGLRDRAVDVRIGDTLHEGVAVGVDEYARLCVTIDGVRQSFDVGEVRVRGALR
jgi:BirA family transcriptional regulator, biotin operon repressor / biotin---[acetyl-CoA-carboxylase] ligase